MINSLALNLIADVMGWENDTATREYAWLQLMSAVKYDGYSDFRAGVRFLESLVTWLKQFEPDDRKVAYELVKRRLVYISSAEMQQVIENFVPEIVTPYLRKVVAAELNIASYMVWGSQKGAQTFSSRLRKCLFIGLSDGSRIDVLRRANAGSLSQEQILPMMNIDPEKWKGLSKDMRKEEGPDARFEDVFLIDDFTASGTTFIRKVDDVWKGKLAKFEKMVKDAKESVGEDFPIADDYNLHIHHYVSTHQARETLLERVDNAEQNWGNKTFRSAIITEGTLLPSTLKLGSINPDTSEMTTGAPDDSLILKLCKKYYDHELFKRLEIHCIEAGQDTMQYGYANCALPLVLEHNTPNNALSLLWAETDNTNGHNMTPLFHRRDRHG